MHPFAQHAHGQCAHRDAAQRCGQPQPLIIATTGIKTDDQRRRADAIRQMIDIGGQIGTARFFASLDHNYAMGAGDILFGKCKEGRKTCEHGIAIVGPAAPIKLAVLQDRRPRSGTIRPSRHLRLFVEVAIKQDLARPIARHVDKDKRGPPLKMHNFETGTRKRTKSRARPVRKQRDGFFHMAMRSPFGVEGGRFVRDADVIGQCRNDVIVPDAFHEAREFSGIHRCSTLLRPEAADVPASAAYRLMS